jgi:hypothetical protein
VAAWFLKNPFARFEVYSIFDEDRVRVILNGGRDWVEFEKEHPVYIEAIRRRKCCRARSLCNDGSQPGVFPDKNLTVAARQPVFAPANRSPS